MSDVSFKVSRSEIRSKVTSNAKLVDGGGIGLNKKARIKNRKSERVKITRTKECEWIELELKI